MLTDESIYFIYGEGTPGVALGFVIDDYLVYDLATWDWVAEIITSSDSVVDVTEEYPELSGLVVEFLKENKSLERLNTSEYFGSVLLSNPLILDMMKYENGENVFYPDAKFIDNKFVYEKVSP
jgi:phage pi2 protein 07